MSTLADLKASAIEQLIEANVAERQELHDLIRDAPYMTDSFIASAARLRVAVRNVALAALGGPIR